MKKRVLLEIEEEALNLIDKARKLEFSTRTNFLIRNAVSEARKILNE